MLQKRHKSNVQIVVFSKYILVLACSLSFCFIKPALGQNLFGLEKSVDIPFEYFNDFIIIDVVFNDALPLKFIFDTGAEHTVLLKKEIAEVSEIPYERRFQIIGSDMRTDLYAYLIRKIPLKIGAIKIANQSLLVLEEDYFDFEEKVGTPIQGIIGADIFRSYQIHIDYEKMILRFALSGEDKFLKNYEKIPIELFKNKPYLSAQVGLTDTSEIQVKLLLDTGAGLALLLHTDTHEDLKLPDRVITGQVGVGLGGDLEGFLGRVRSLDLPNTGYSLNNIVTNFQELNEQLDTTQLNHRNGLLGNQVLKRFRVVIDYPMGILYLKRNRRYKSKFEFDKSGLIVVAAGKNLTNYYVTKVLPNSPAAEAGIIRGDRIIKINGTDTWLMNLESILNRLKRKTGKKIKLTIRRNNAKMKREFRLRDLI